MADQSTMNVATAVSKIIGDELAHSIISDMGINWAVVAAMAEAKTPAHDREVVVIRKYLAEKKKERGL